MIGLGMTEAPALLNTMLTVGAYSRRVGGCWGHLQPGMRGHDEGGATACIRRPGHKGCCPYKRGCGVTGILLKQACLVCGKGVHPAVRVSNVCRAGYGVVDSWGLFQGATAEALAHPAHKRCLGKRWQDFILHVALVGDHGARAGCMSLCNIIGALCCLLAVRADILCDVDWVKCSGRGCGQTFQRARVVCCDRGCLSSPCLLFPGALNSYGCRRERGMGLPLRHVYLFQFRAAWATCLSVFWVDAGDRALL